MPIILLVVAAWLFILSIVNWFRGYGEVGAIWFLGTWLLVGLSGVMSRLDALCRRFDADTRALPIKRKKPAVPQDEADSPSETAAADGRAGPESGQAAPAAETDSKPSDSQA